MVTEKLLGKHCDGEEEEEAPGESMQLAHQPVLPSDLRPIVQSEASIQVTWSCLNQSQTSITWDSSTLVVVSPPVITSITLSMLLYVSMFLLFYLFLVITISFHNDSDTKHIDVKEWIRMVPDHSWYLFVVNHLSKIFIIMHFAYSGIV